MNKTLNIYPNFQTDKIAVQDYTVMEIYKDSIAKDNSLGYWVLPIQDLTVAQIQEQIDTKLIEWLPSGYVNYITYPLDATIKDYNRSICYCIYYNDTIPTQPKEKTIPAIQSPTSFDPFTSFMVENNGSLESSIKIKITPNSGIELDNIIVFYINENKYSVKIEDYSLPPKELVITREKISYDGLNIDTFEFDAPLTIHKNSNTIKFKANNLEHINISYVPKF